MLTLDEAFTPNSQYNLYDQKYPTGNSTSLNPGEDQAEYKTITTGFDGTTQKFEYRDIGAEKRSHSSTGRSWSFAVPSCLSLSKRSRKLLYPVMKWFMEQVCVLREIEHLRLELSHTPDFNLVDAYKIFSVNRLPNLAKHEFLRGWKSFGIITRNKEKLLNIYTRYASDLNSKLTFQQFWRIFVPFNCEHEKEVRERKPLYGARFPKRL